MKSKLFFSNDNECNGERPIKNSRRQFIKKIAYAGSVISVPALSTQVLSEQFSSSYNNDVNTSHDLCSQNSLKKGLSYFNSGTEGSMPSCVLNVFHEKLKRWTSNPTYSYEKDKELGKHQHYQRESIAKTFSVDKDNICLTDNTTMGLSMVLMGLNFSSQDKIIYTNQEHTAITSPLSVQKEKLGLQLIKRNFPEASKLKNITSEALIDFLFPNSKELYGAKALCVSHVYPSTGVRLPLQLLRKKADQLNIQYLIVDGAQAFGMIDISQGIDDIKQIDFYACPGHKWLNGPPSTGLLFIKNKTIKPPEFYPVLSQRMEKYKNGSFPMAEALQVRGCSNTVGFTAMLKAVQFQQDLGGFKAIENDLIKKSQLIKQFIQSQSQQALISPFIDKKLSSALTVFFPFSWNKPNRLFTDKQTANKVVEKLLEKNIQIRSIGFFDGRTNKSKSYALRVSTAIFNNDEEIKMLLKSIKAVLSDI